MDVKYLYQQPSTVGLLGHWKLWAGFTSGVSVFDYSLNSNEGTVSGAVASYPGFDFTAGSSMFIDIGTGPSVVKTISLWVNQDDVAGNEYPIDLNGTDYLSVELGVVTANGFVAGAATLYVDGVVGTSGVTTISAGAWHLINITDSVSRNAFDLDIGRVTAAYFDGLIDDVMIFNVVKTAAEIKSIYEVTRQRYGV